LTPLKQSASQPNSGVSNPCADPALCPLSRVQAGSVVCIKALAASPELSERLRELGFCEQQTIKLLARNSNFICQVCNARLGISEKLAEFIMVEAPTRHPTTI
jgi:Fe2+ transport system protein FeoA